MSGSRPISELTYEEFIAHALELRSRIADAEREFLEWLLLAETQARHLWEGSGKTFQQWLEGENLCKGSRYDAYKRVRNTLGSEAVKSVGIEGIMAAGRKGSTPEMQREVIAQSKEFERTNQTAISEQTAGDFAREVRARMAGRRSSKSYATLLRDFERAEKEIERFKVKVVALEAELRKWKKNALDLEAELRNWKKKAGPKREETRPS